MNTNARWKSLLGALALLGAGHAAAQVTLYEHDGFGGRSVRVNNEVQNLSRIGFNDRASSMVIERGRWEVCNDARFGGRCVVLGRGEYDSLAAIGLDDRVSSARQLNRKAYNYNARGVYVAGSPDYRRRSNERTYEAQVTSVRAVVGPPEQRCWVEQEQVVQQGGYGSGNVNVPGAIAGAVIGGILGHQIGGGRGQDIATAGGAVGGAALGANIGRGDGQQVVTRDVQRCTNVSSGRPEYWDVTYNFRGAEHRVQMTAPPGPTILVNRQGEPRV
jgi:uncharacterized protein YcfJ